MNHHICDVSPSVESYPMSDEYVDQQGDVLVNGIMLGGTGLVQEDRSVYS